ncbi:MAG: site-2 protease family protein [Victivallales bacterium]|nr:site-2 protease family protein [Victivallales bacterium]
MYLFIQFLWEDPSQYFCWILAMMFSSCLHEYVHTLVTYKLREAQALIRATFTLNPLAIYDKVALICLAIFGIIWGYQPIRTDMLKSYRKGAVIGIAGPILNLFLAFVFAFLTFLCLRFMTNALGHAIFAIYIKFLIIACHVNCLLIVLNLMPIPGLDGWTIMEAFFAPVRNIDFAKRNIITFTAIILLWATPVARILYRLHDFIFYIVNQPFMKCLSE